MTRSAFPDIIGPSKVAANGGTGVGLRDRTLNIVSSGVSAADNSARRRTDLTFSDAAWSVVTVSIVTSGEFLPILTAFGTAGLVRVQSSTTGSLLTGLDSGDDPTTLVKFFGNVGSNTVTLQAPVSPVAGKQYFAAGTSVALTANSTVRAVWDTVTRVYRVQTSSVVVTDYLVLDGDRIVLDGDPILNPE